MICVPYIFSSNQTENCLFIFENIIAEKKKKKNLEREREKTEDFGINVDMVVDVCCMRWPMHTHTRTESNRFLKC